MRSAEGRPVDRRLGAMKPRRMRILESHFELSRRGSSVRTEVVAGLTTFLTMAYIIVVNAQILGDAGMPRASVVTATCLSAGLASMLMGIWARLPVALAPGMGTNAYFAYFVVGTLGVPWPTALGAVFVSGVVFLLLSLTGVRERVIAAIPLSMKHAIAAGIGVFIAFVGLRNAGLVVDHPSVLVQLGDASSPGALVFLVGLLSTTVLVAWRARGALLLGILLATGLAVGLGVSSPPRALVSLPPSIEPTFLALDIAAALELGLLHLVFAFVFVDLFDTIATLVAVAEQGGLMEGTPGGGRRLPRATAALSSDAIGTLLGSLVGTSTVTSYVESTAGIAAGGRTGLTAVVVGVCFLAAPVFAPIVAVVPAQATAPVLVLVAVLMVRALAHVRFDDPTEAVPAVLTCLAIPFTFSISDGLALGFIVYPLVKILAGRAREVSPLMALLAFAFLAKLAWLD